MKKRIYSFVAMIALWTAGTPAWATPVGTFTGVAGLVDITSPGSPARPATKGDAVAEADIVRTKSGARAEITFADGSVIRIAPDSRIQVSSYFIQGKTASSTLDLFRGKVQSIVRKQMSRLFNRGDVNRYEIRTPTAVCGARGTDFFVYYLRGVSGAVFREGSGYGYNFGMPDDILAIRSGEAMLVQSIADMPVIRGVSDAEINLHLRDTEVSGTSAEGDETASKASKSVTDVAEEESGSEKAGSSATGLSSFFTGFMGNMNADEVSRVKLFSYDIDIGAYAETENYFYDVDIENGAAGVHLPETSGFVPLNPDIGILIGDLDAHIEDVWNLYVGNTPGYFDDGASLVGSIYVSPMVNQIDWIRGQEWQKSDLYFAGTYTSADGLTYDDWNLDLEYREINTRRNFHFNGTRWSEGKIEADVASTWVNWRECFTAVGGGDMQGAYSEDTGAWSGTGRMVSMGTDMFLDMAANRPGDLETLNIPCVEIGRATLTGSGHDLDVRMEDVAFFSYSTGADPALWATNRVSGTFTGTPSQGAGVALVGDGLNADFVVESFASDKWSASITGGKGDLTRSDTGTVQNIEFRGGAAGAIDEAAGTFSGSGSGIAVKGD